MSDEIDVESDLLPFGMVPEWISENPALSDRAVRLYAILMRISDNKKKTGTLGRKTLAAKLRCSVDSLDRAVSELKSVGALRVQGRRDDKGDHTSNLWQVRFYPPGGGRTAAATRTGAATGGREDAALSIREIDLDENNCAVQDSTALVLVPMQPAVAGRNELWDVLVELCGQVTTRNEQSRRGKVVKELLSMGVSAAEVRVRVANYPKDWDLTDTALMSHWSKCERPSARRLQGRDRAIAEFHEANGMNLWG